MLDERFEVNRHLAQGGMADVLGAYDRARRCHVALKVARSDRDVARYQQRAASLRREAEVLGLLSHPNIVTAHDHLSLPGGEVLVLEYVAGAGDRRRPCRWQIPAIALEICDALEHVHRRGFVHLDLKRENVLVSDTGRVCLVDFGISQRPGPQVPLVGGGRGPSGTRRVMSPEHLAGDAVDERSDLYSFGVYLYEALAGRALGETGAAAYVPLGDTAWDLPLELTMLVDQMLCVDPAARPASAAEVGERLRLALR